MPADGSARPGPPASERGGVEVLDGGSVFCDEHGPAPILWGERGPECSLCSAERGDAPARGHQVAIEAHRLSFHERTFVSLRNLAARYRREGRDQYDAPLEEVERDG